ncbi:MAG: ABC transporter ATP-binding protein [Candidatus Eiseniibacteriota bacterium]
MAAIVALDQVGYAFAGAPAPLYKGVTLAVERGAFTTVVGASGAGKSTLLRIVANLIAPTEGTIAHSIAGGADRRPIAMVFQEPRLMPWRRVADTVALGLEGLSLAGDERRERVRAALALVGLGELGARWPHELSGGQRQRVGIARAIAVGPDLLLMDEPFGALDAITRQAMQDELLRIWQETGTSILFVTHDIDEAVYLGDRVLLLGGAPTRISETYAVTAPRPRTRGTQAVASIAARVKSDLSDLFSAGAGI